MIRTDGHCWNICTRCGQTFFSNSWNDCLCDECVDEINSKYVKQIVSAKKLRLPHSQKCFMCGRSFVTDEPFGTLCGVCSVKFDETMELLARENRGDLPKNIDTSVYRGMKSSFLRSSYE